MGGGGRFLLQRQLTPAGTGGCLKDKSILISSTRGWILNDGLYETEKWCLSSSVVVEERAEQ